MKRIILALIALFSLLTSGNVTAADIADGPSPDSIYVIANFSKNDTLEYVYTSEETKIKGADTTTVTIEERKFRLVVLDSTATGYRIQYTELETKSSLSEGIGNVDNDPKQMMLKHINDIIHKNDTKIPITFTTNEIGEIQHIENWQELRNNILKTLDECWDEVFRTIPGASEYVDKNSFAELFKAKFSSEEQLIENLEGFPLLFSFHGSALHIGNKTIENEGNEEEYPSTVQVSAYYFDPDEKGRDDFYPDYEVAIISTSTAHGDDVKELVKELMDFILNDNDNSQDVMKSLDASKDFDNATMKIHEGIDAYYWFNGWPREVTHFNVIELDAPDNNSQLRIKSQSIECVYRSCSNIVR